jgi:L-lactate dehydrogenase complex protein LldG
MIGTKKEIRMSSRESILKRIKANKPSLLDLPEIDMSIFFDKDENQLSKFKKMIEAVGGDLLELNSKDEFVSKLIELFPIAKNNFSNVIEASGFNSIDISEIEKPQELDDLDVLVLEGEIGVAENGAIWIPEDSIPVRVLPFITKHLVLVLDESKIVATQHHAFENIENSDFDYGIFISGPSKTADIEQSLVIGAQGALSLTVFLVKG